MIGMSKQITQKVKLPGGLLISLMIVLLLASFITGCTKANTAAQPQTSSSQVSSSGNIVIPLFDETTTTSLYERLIPGIVEIDTVLNSNTGSSNLFGTTPQQMGQGSGFFIDDKGHILTNNHVVENAKSVSVVIHDGDSIDATIVGTDPLSDLAVILVDPAKVGKITVMTLGDSANVIPGQMAIALGSPYGLEGSITVGVVSGIGRSQSSITNRTISNMIQTDAAINPGNSGGPLLNSKGEVIGINTDILASSTGVGFAIPINTAKTKLTTLLAGGELKAAWLGITALSGKLDSNTIKQLGLTVQKGVYVIDVTKDGPADKAGIKGGGTGTGNGTSGLPGKGGDVITAIDGVSVAQVEDILSYLDSKKPGDTVTLSVNRNGNQISVKATLGEWPANLANPS